MQTKVSGARNVQTQKALLEKSWAWETTHPCACTDKSIITKWHPKTLKNVLKCTIDRQTFTFILFIYLSFTVESSYLPLITSKNWGSLKRQKKNTTKGFLYIRIYVEMYVGEMYGPKTIQISKDDSRHFTDGSHSILWERSSEKQYVWFCKVKQSRSMFKHHPLDSSYTIQCHAHSCSPCAYNFNHSLISHARS